MVGWSQGYSFLVGVKSVGRVSQLDWISSPFKLTVEQVKNLQNLFIDFRLQFLHGWSNPKAQKETICTVGQILKR